MTQPSAQNTQSAPIVDLTAKPAPAAVKRSNNTNRSLILGGGALALIGFVAAAYAVSRRRRREDGWHGDWNDEPVFERESAAGATAAVEPRHDPITYDEEAGVVAPSSFAWDAAAPAKQESQRDSSDDRLPGETWVQRAYRGPSANNPSVSLKNRLRRAAFFDKRERDVAAGLAEPVDPDAGLPDGMADQPERELA